jgi:hypothetical protein
MHCSMIFDLIQWGRLELTANDVPLLLTAGQDIYPCALNEARITHDASSIAYNALVIRAHRDLNSIGIAQFNSAGYNMFA